MNHKILLATFLIFSLNPLIAQAQDCIRGNPKQSTYQLRDNYRRCEGIKPVDVSGSFSLISLSTGRLNDNSNPLTLDVPNIGIPEQQLKVTVQSLQKNYQLIPLEFKPINPRFHFEWSNDVLKKAEIPFDSLNYLTAFLSGSEPVYVPVILGQTSGNYDIVLYSNRYVKITLFQILQKGQVIYNHADLDSYSPGKIFLTWDGSARAGRYQLLIKAKLIPPNGSPQDASINITFEHNPNWLQ